MRELPTGTVTLLFTDIEGSTRMLQHMSGRYASLLETCRELLRAAFLEFHGHEVDTQGDAFFVAFARTTDAISAVVAAQRSLFTHTWPEGVAVRVRMGLHTGEPQLASEGYVGLDVHHAARIMSAGHGGQVLLSQTTRDLVEYALPDGVSLLDVGIHRLKDLQQPCHLFQLSIAGLPADFPPLKTLDRSPHNLPIQPTPFIGREKEVTAIIALLRREEVHLVTLTGPGGTGKTRLGLQVAAELSDSFADGVCFVNLAPLSDPELVIPAIAEVLNVKEMAEQTLLALLQAYLREKHLLLVLDNFEQVVLAALQVAELLTFCPKLKILVTSRMALHLRAEQEFAVPPLTLPDPKRLPDPVVLAQYEAVAMFIQRARAIKSDFQVTNATAPAVAEMCVRLDGLPLAIELAAARIKLFPPQALLARLGQRLAVLTGGARDAPARQQTLRNTIEWSYQLLDTDEQRLFRRLCIFVGGCTLEAVESISAALGDDASQVMNGVTSLIDKNLLQRTEQEGEEARLVMLETIREYGLDMLSTHGDMETARQVYATYYLELAEEAARGYKSSQPAEWLERLEREHDNLRATMEWSLESGHTGPHLEIAFKLSEALMDFWRVRGFYSEGRIYLEQILARRDSVATPMRARAMSAAAEFADWQSDFDRAEALYQKSLLLYRELGDTRGIAWSLWRLEAARKKDNKYPALISQLEESLSLFRGLGDQEAIALSLLELADQASFHGDYRRGYTLFEESLAILKELGIKRGIADCLRQSALWLFLGAQGDQAIIHARLEESLVIYRELGDKNGEAFYCWTAGWLAFKEGDAGTAQALLEQCVKLWQEMGSLWQACGALAFLGRIKAHQGNFAVARSLLKESLDIARALDDYVRAFCLERLAIVVTAQGESMWSARLLGTAEALRENCGAPASPMERADYEPSMATAWTHLGEQAFNAAWDEGRSMTFVQVLAPLML